MTSISNQHISGNRMKQLLHHTITNCNSAFTEHN